MNSEETSEFKEQSLKKNHVSKEEIKQSASTSNDEFLHSKHHLEDSLSIGSSDSDSIYFSIEEDSSISSLQEDNLPNSKISNNIKKGDAVRDLENKFTLKTVFKSIYRKLIPKQSKKYSEEKEGIGVRMREKLRDSRFLNKSKNISSYDKQTYEIVELLFKRKDIPKEELLSLINEYVDARQKQRVDFSIPKIETNSSSKTESSKETMKQYHQGKLARSMKQFGRTISALWKSTRKIIRDVRFFDKITLRKAKNSRVFTTSNKEQQSKEEIGQGELAQRPQMAKKSSTAEKNSSILFTHKLHTANEASKTANTSLTNNKSHPISKERR